jgi:hypothetical protein
VQRVAARVEPVRRAVERAAPQLEPARPADRPVPVGQARQTVASPGLDGAQPQEALRRVARARPATPALATVTQARVARIVPALGRPTPATVRPAPASPPRSGARLASMPRADAAPRAGGAPDAAVQQGPAQASTAAGATSGAAAAWALVPRAAPMPAPTAWTLLFSAPPRMRPALLASALERPG